MKIKREKKETTKHKHTRRDDPLYTLPLCTHTSTSEKRGEPRNTIILSSFQPYNTLAFFLPSFVEHNQEKNLYSTDLICKLT